MPHDLQRYYQFARPTQISVDLHDGNGAQRRSLADSPNPQTLDVTGTTDQVTITILSSAPPDATKVIAGSQVTFQNPAIGEITVTGSPASS